MKNTLLLISVLFLAITSCAKEELIIMLSSDKTEITADGKDAATLKVTSSGKDITSECRFEANGTILPDNKFTSTQSGTYTVKAFYKDTVSNYISIIATASDDPENHDDNPGDEPDDPEPPRYEGFKTRVLMVEFTGLWCGYCPLMRAACEELIDEQGWDNGVLVCCHRKDDFTPYFSGYIWENFNAGMMGIPSMTYNLDRKTVVSIRQQHVASIMNDIRNKAEELIEENPATCGISAEFGGNESSLELSAKIFIGDDSEYRVLAWIIEDGLYGEQKNYTPHIVPNDGLEIHNSVLRETSSQDMLGEPLPKGAETTQSFSYSFKTDGLGIQDISKTSAVVMVLKKGDDGAFVVNNTAVCRYGRSIACDYI